MNQLQRALVDEYCPEPSLIVNLVSKSRGVDNSE